MINSFRKKNRYRKFGEVSLTPLIDVALTLVVALMIAMPVTQNAVKIALPQGSVNESDAQKARLIVNIDAENNLYFNNEKMEPEKLLLELARNLEKQDGTVFLKADQLVNYGYLMKVIDCIKSLKYVNNVVLLTNKA